MTISAWVAVVLFVSISQGTVVVSDDETHVTKAACEDRNQRMIALVKTKELWEDVLAYGTSCTEVAVTEVPQVPRPAGVKPGARKESI